MKLEEIGCYVCGSNENRFYDEENGFRLVKCAGCGLVYLSPRPTSEEITAAHKTGQHHGESVIDVTGCFDKSKLPRYQKILKDFFPQEISPGKRWLDVGCGHGEFLEALKKHSSGLVLKGCEPNATKVAGARTRGLDVSFFDLNEHREQYDFLSLLNVYSHLPDPVEILRAWKHLLKEDGILFLETGHSAHLSPKHHHKPYHLPDHLSFASEELLHKVLDKAGFKVLEIRKYRHTVFPELNRATITQEIRKFLGGKKHRLNKFFPKDPNRDMYIKAVRLD